MHRALLGAALAVLVTVVAVPGAAAGSQSSAYAAAGRGAAFDLQGHRGTRGLRPEDPAIFHGPVVAELQKRGTKVIPYTVNYEAVMERVIDLGVDGIISDDVDLLLLVAKRNGLV